MKAKVDKILGPPGARAGIGLSLPFLSTIRLEIDKGPEMLSGLPIGNIPPEAAPDPNQVLSDNEKQQIQQLIDTDFDLRQQLASAVSRAPTGEPRSRSITGATATTTLMDPEVLADVAPSAAGGPVDRQGRSFLGAIALGKYVVVVVASVIWRFAQRRDHGPYLTIVEEIMRALYVRALGRSLWLDMKEAIDNAFPIRTRFRRCSTCRQVAPVLAVGNETQCDSGRPQRRSDLRLAAADRVTPQDGP